MWHHQLSVIDSVYFNLCHGSLWMHLEMFLNLLPAFVSLFLWAGILPVLGLSE